MERGGYRGRSDNRRGGRGDDGQRRGRGRYTQAQSHGGQVGSTQGQSRGGRGCYSQGQSRGGRGGYTQGPSRGGRGGYTEYQSRGGRGGYTQGGGDYSQGQIRGADDGSYQRHLEQTPPQQSQQNWSQIVSREGQRLEQSIIRESQWRLAASSSQNRQQGEPPATSGLTTYQVAIGAGTPVVPAVRTSPSSDLVKDSAMRDVPIKRPDAGGTLAVRTASLLVNHFRVEFNPQSIIKHYDVDIKPVIPANSSRPVKIPESDMAMIRDKLFAEEHGVFPLSMTGYDGAKNIFSAVELPTGEFKVEFAEGEDVKFRSYMFTIKHVNDLKLGKLKDYIDKRVLTVPRDILQGLDVVMKENSSRTMITLGRSFHPIASAPENDLGSGITASRGFQHSLKTTSQGLVLCLDYSVLAFRKRMPVIDFLKEHIYNFHVNSFGEWGRVENALKGLKVTVTHRKTKQKYVVAGLTKESTRHLSFIAEDPEGKVPPKQVKLIDYFKEKYNVDVIYQDFPCLDVGKNKRQNYIPMELCVLVEGQIYPKEQLDRNAGIFLKNLSLAKPEKRKKTINDLVHSNVGPCSGEITKNFEINVETVMTSVVGRVLQPPDLRLAALGGKSLQVPVDKEKCHWNLVGKGVVEGKRIERWAILDFIYNDRPGLRDRFVGNLMGRCKKLGMIMEEPVHICTTRMSTFSNVDKLHEVLTGVTNVASKRGRGPLQILVCVMSEKHKGYKYLKWVSEIKIGVVTQCCLSKLAYEGKDQYLANLALKINAKVGGSNVELINRLPCFEGEDHVMFVGADVNHPCARDKLNPSIAAVVGTVNWPAANRYVARVQPQCHRTEKIKNFGDMCLELVKSYAKLNGARPKKIVIFRDGVSEGQFDMVLNEELVQLKRAFQAMNYTPTISLIVAQKRHQTRLFPARQRDGGSTGNVYPGTVVDTVIVHPFEFDFYLCSHYGSLGTSKPTHYYVLWDEHRFSSDQLQKLIYDMCFTFARCTKPVSLVPPVYYADLVAYRGRLYHEAVMESQSRALVSSPSSSSSSSYDSPSLFHLHAEMENKMYFV